MRALILWVLCLMMATAWADAVKPPVTAPSATDQAMAEHAALLAKSATGTIGQEAANCLMTEPVFTDLRRLLGRIPATAAELTAAHNTVAPIAARLDAARTWPKPMTIYIPYSYRPADIDGRLDDIGWQMAACFAKGFPLNSATPATTPETIWRMMWNEQYLYVAMECKDTQITVKSGKQDGAITDGDCLVLNLRPDADKSEIWQLLLAPGDGAATSRLVRKRAVEPGVEVVNDAQLPGWRCGYTTIATRDPKTGESHDTGYVLEVAIPWTALRATPAYSTGSTIALMPARIDRNGEAAPVTFTMQPTLDSVENLWGYPTVMLVKYPN